MPTQPIQSAASSVASILSHPTWDIIMALTFVAIGFFYGISRGKQKVISVMFYTYASYAIQPALPVGRIKEMTGVESLFLLKAGLFLLTIFLFVALLGARSRIRSSLRAGSLWHTFILTFAQSGLLIHLTLSFLPPERVRTLAPLTRTVFANPDLHIWWLVIPLALLAILKRLGVREE